MPAVAPTRLAAVDSHADERMVAATSGAAAMKFAYASGSTPLPGYSIKRGVGIGGFGEVYYALSEAGKEVALKRIQRNLDVELRGVSQCLNLKHPNLVSLYDIRYDDAGQAWVIMEFVHGPTLREVLDRHPNGLNRDEVDNTFGQLAAGVAHLHDNGLVHRDLKPGNVFDDSGMIKIGDYGLSKFISASRRGGQTESVGTFHYMAPEVGRGEYGKEIDIYALGIMLYELLTGLVPFDGESSHEIVMKHLTADPDLRSIPDPYRQVIWQALQKNPASRQRDVRQMLKPLGLAIDERGLLVRTAHVAASPAAVSHPQNGPVFTPAPPVEGVEIRYVAAAAPQADISFGPVREHRRHGTAARGPAPFMAAPVAGNPWPGGSVAFEEEPIAATVRRSVGGLVQWWRSLDLPAGARIVVLVIAALFVLINTSWLVPLLTALAILYVPYYIIRSIIYRPSTAPVQFVGGPLVGAYPAPMRPDRLPPRPKPLTFKQWREAKRPQLAAKPIQVRGSEMVASWCKAALIVVAISGIATLLGNDSRELTAQGISPIVWSGVMAMAAALSVLGLGKLWETDEGDGFSRRMVLLGVGGAIGAMGYVLADYLMVPRQITWENMHGMQHLPERLYVGQQAELPAFMAHYALLLAGLRWWRPTDPLRRSRLGLIGVAFAIGYAALLNSFLPIPQPWGLLSAGTLAVALPMAATWVNPRERFKAVA
jgi:hypothetical protein